jgi:hypothetical protein
MWLNGNTKAGISPCVYVLCLIAGIDRDVLTQGDQAEIAPLEAKHSETGEMRTAIAPKFSASDGMR